MASTAALDPGLLRQALGQFASGVTVVTTVLADGTPIGCTMSAFCSLSLDPPLVLVCIGKGRAMRDPLVLGEGFVVNVLRDDQADVALTFARPIEDRFASVETSVGGLGIPTIDGAIAKLECERYDILPGGDHEIVLGRIRDVSVAEGAPLLYSQGAFLELPEDDWPRASAAASHEWLLSAPW